MNGVISSEKENSTKTETTQEKNSESPEREIGTGGAQADA